MVKGFLRDVLGEPIETLRGLEQGKVIQMRAVLEQHEGELALVCEAARVNVEARIEQLQMLGFHVEQLGEKRFVVKPGAEEVVEQCVDWAAQTIAVIQTAVEDRLVSIEEVRAAELASATPRKTLLEWLEAQEDDNS